MDQYADVVCLYTDDSVDSGLLPFHFQCSVNLDSSHNSSTTSKTTGNSTPQSNDNAMGHHQYKKEDDRATDMASTAQPNNDNNTARG
jgi:hypothetical protein